jgi:hypothetical protein
MRENYSAVRHLHAQGLPRTLIGRKLGLHPATARSADDLIAKTEQRTHLVAPWSGHLNRSWHEGERNATQLFREIRQLGYPGGELAVQRYLRRFRQDPAPCRSRVPTAKVICSTNAIESLNARYRRAVKTRGHFRTELAALKCLYLVTPSLDPTGTGQARWTMWWNRPSTLRHHLR